MKMMEAVTLQNQFPDVVVGFDLVDEEDRFYTLLHYLGLFMKMDKYTKSNNMTGKSCRDQIEDSKSFEQPCPIISTQARLFGTKNRTRISMTLLC